MTASLKLDEAASARVNRFYDFVLDWVLEHASLARGKTASHEAVVVGFCAPQGAGKTTLTQSLVARAAERGQRAISLSIDDFYLTRQEQIALAEANPSNPFLQARGYPGTHDVELGRRVLEALKHLGPGRSLHVPCYDKSAHEGRGDRKPEMDWPEVRGPFDLVFLEGWMLGFPPLEHEFVTTDANLLKIDRYLRAYGAWISMLDLWIGLMPRDHRFVLKWRVEAEEKMKATGRSGMSREAIEAYVRTFLPAYETYLPRLATRPPLPLDRSLTLTIEEDRLPSEGF